MSELDVRTIGTGLLIVAALVLAGYFWSATGLVPADFFPPSPDGLYQKLLSVSFALFLVSLSLVAGIIGAAIRILDAPQVRVGVLTGIIAGTILSAVLWNLGAFVLMGIFLTVGFIAAMETGIRQKSEIKSFASFRLPLQAMGTFSMIFAIGLVVWSAAAVLPTQSVIADAFLDEIVNISVGSFSQETMLNQIQQSLVDNAAALYVQSQQQLLSQIMARPSFEIIAARADSDSQQFAAELVMIGEQLASPAYVAAVKQQLNNSFDTSASSLPNTETLAKNMLRNQIPLVSVGLQYLWLLLGLGFASLWLMLSSFVLKPLSALWGGLFSVLLSQLRKQDTVVQIAPEIAPEK